MTERTANETGAIACPFVAFVDDRDERADLPDHRHRCYAEIRPAQRALAHQQAFCLSAGFAACPTFQDWARREAARARGVASAGRPAEAAGGGAESVESAPERRRPGRGRRVRVRRSRARGRPVRRPGDAEPAPRLGCPATVGGTGSAGGARADRAGGAVVPHPAPGQGRCRGHGRADRPVDRRAGSRRSRRRDRTMRHPGQTGTTTSSSGPWRKTGRTASEPPRPPSAGSARPPRAAVPLARPSRRRRPRPSRRRGASRSPATRPVRPGSALADTRPTRR